MYRAHEFPVARAEQCVRLCTVSSKLRDIVGRVLIFAACTAALISLMPIRSSEKKNIKYGTRVQQNTSSPAAIMAQCESFLERNRLTGDAFGYEYSFNQPSSHKYSPSQWLWGK